MIPLKASIAALVILLPSVALADPYSLPFSGRIAVWEPIEVVGKVKTIDVRPVLITIRDGKPVENRMLATRYTFDDAGSLVEMAGLATDDGKVTERPLKLKYEKGRLAEVVVYNLGPDPVAIYKLKYSEDGKTCKVEERDPKGTLLQHATAELNEKMMPTKLSVGDGAITAEPVMATIKYDEKGRWDEIMEGKLDDSGMSSFRYKCVYNEKGFLDSQEKANRSFGPPGKPGVYKTVEKMKYAYEYDEKGNWTKCSITKTSYQGAEQSVLWQVIGRGILY